ncbi:MAG: hypothetical protein KME32_03980 [Mojavia pulchra JT2-VF2]|uniref:Uncharacterized protein n=1 Tax=Mojavia pulchra JT2-VF2 TaxID=287848 RepID=A0A951UER9_9NOST|nr:hypothetical protein [Mojavia pulchra JT2-VF2]
MISSLIRAIAPNPITETTQELFSRWKTGAIACGHDQKSQQRRPKPE